jgi:hypothetical protein
MNGSSSTLFDTLPPPPEDDRPVVFLDRTFSSAKIAAHLRSFKEWRVELHGSWFVGDCADPVWIRECTKRGWILLSCDKEIRRSPEIRDAVEKCGAKLFYLNAKKKRAEDYMSILSTARHRILRIAKQNKGPFYAIIHATSEVRLVGLEPTQTSRERTRRKYVKGAAYRTHNVGQPKTRRRPRKAT